MIVDIKFSSTSIAESQIVAFEDFIGAKLPTDYRLFLLRNNGGKPNPKRFKSENKKIESMVSEFFPLNEKEENLIEEYEGFILAEQLPENFLCIGKDPADNRIVLSLKGDDAGAVYYWSWDEEPTPPSRSHAYLSFISDNFQKFLRSLY